MSATALGRQTEGRCLPMHEEGTMSAKGEQYDRAGISHARSDAEIPSLSVSERLRTPLQRKEDGSVIFVVRELETTQAFNRATHRWITQSITSILDPLGIVGETLIGQRRTERPKAEARPAPKASFEEETFKALFPLFAHPENEWLLTALVEGIENSNILGWIYRELVTLPDQQRVDNLKRKILLNPAVPEDILYSNCIFCNVGPAQVIDSLGKPHGAISIHNDYPFGPLMHKVLILQERKHDISEITADEILTFYELLYRIGGATRETYGAELDGLTYGMNYGLPRIHKGRQVIASGASQPHLHSQVAALSRSSHNSGDRIGVLCKAYRETYNRDYLGDYMVALRAADLILHEDDNAILYVPVAQRFDNELQIMVRNPAVGNILDTTPEIRRSVASLEHLAYAMYQHPELNIQSFNTVMYAARFSATNDFGQRMIVSICPRTTIVALSELAHRNVVDSFPWRSAQSLRACKEEVMTQGPRKLTVLAVGAHPDDIELGCGGALLELRKRNHEIHALVVTDGCGGTGRVPEIRERESNAAAEVLGIRTVSFAGIRDGQAHLKDSVFEVIKGQVERHKPDVVISHASITSEHSDHKNVSEVVKTVCARTRPRPILLTFEVPAYAVDASFRPNVFVNIHSAIDGKKSAVCQHQSEIERGTIGTEQVESRATLRANEVGPDVSYAEAFVCDGSEEEVANLARLMPFVLVK